MFGCYDTTTMIMDNLNYNDSRTLTYLNKKFNEIKDQNYYKFRIIQNFIRKRIIKCHLNESNCYKIKFNDLITHTSYFLGKRMQMIFKPQSMNNLSFCGYTHYILWECDFIGLITNYPQYISGIRCKNINKINFNIYKKCNCDSTNFYNHGSTVENNISFNNLCKFSLRVLC